MDFYALTGHVRSEIPVEYCQEKAMSYRQLAGAAEDCRGAVVSTARAVTQANRGAATTAFTTQATGAAGVAPHLQQVATAANQTSEAYAIAGAVGAFARGAMDAVDAEANRWSAWAAILPPLKAHLIADADRRMDAIERYATTTIDNAFKAIKLPAARTYTARDPGTQAERTGHVDPRIAAQWSRMTDAQRRAALQRMADEYATQHNLPKITLTFDDLPAGTNGEHDSQYYPSTITIDVDRLQHPEAISTTYHEMAHYRCLSGRIQTDPNDNKPVGDMTPADRERWNEREGSWPTSRGGRDTYNPNPDEVYARQEGRDALNQMSHADFQKYTK